MSRLRVSNRPDGWLDEGPQVVPPYRGQNLSGSLVVGVSDAPFPTVKRTPLPAEEHRKTAKEWNQKGRAA